MRIIDADSLVRNIKKWEKYIGKYEKYIPYDEDIYVSTMLTIEDEPTVDAVPVRHGRWIKYTGMGKVQWMCSECGAEEKNPKVANWCYHCGARMDADD